MGPKQARTTVLSLEEEAVIVAFRRHTLLPLDDCLYGLQPVGRAASNPAPDALIAAPLPGAACRLCRHPAGGSGPRPDGISRLPPIEGDKPEKKRFASYPIGYFHVDLAEVPTGEGKLWLFVAVDRTSKFAFVRLAESAGKIEAAQFLPDLVEAVP